MQCGMVLAPHDVVVEMYFVTTVKLCNLVLITTPFPHYYRVFCWLMPITPTQTFNMLMYCTTSVLYLCVMMLIHVHSTVKCYVHAIGARKPFVRSKFDSF